MPLVRTESRYEIRGRAVATILGHPDIRVACEIHDFSRSGMCIAMNQEIPSGRIVKVEWSDHFLVGRVQRVSGAGANFLVGLELLYCSKWSEPVASTLGSASAIA
jgi:uncharacterized protein (UPF0248 family)